MLQITFPEFEKRCHVFSESMRVFLKQLPSARLIKAIDPWVLQQALNYDDGRKVAPFSGEDIVAEAQKSVASESIAMELIIPEHLMEKRDKIATALVVACESLMIEDIEIITSISGIGNTMASAFLAEVGDYRLFPSYKHLVAFAGLDPSIHQSGKFEGASRISKRGNHHLRHLIFLMTSCVVRQDNIFKVYYQKRRTEGLPFKKAIHATAHKLLRVLFAMLSSRTTSAEKG